jgi:VPDSG-CTERM motif
MLINKLAVMAAILTLAALHQAQGTFVQNTDFKGELKLFNDADHKAVTSFDSTVGGHSGPVVNVSTNGTELVDSGAGFATIKPVIGGTLSELIFTPADNTLFSDFSFRGQLTTAGTVTLTVFDQFGIAFPFTTKSEGKDDDIPRFGVISLDGETIDHVVLTANTFKEFKQVEFSFGGTGVPDGGSTVMLLGAALGAVGMVRRFLMS